MNGNYAIDLYCVIDNCAIDYCYDMHNFATDHCKNTYITMLWDIVTIHIKTLHNSSDIDNNDINNMPLMSYF